MSTPSLGDRVTITRDDGSVASGTINWVGSTQATFSNEQTGILEFFFHVRKASWSLTKRDSV